MLSHPWLNMPPNYETKYTDKEYEIMMLKKELKSKVKPGTKGAANDLEDEPQEMNELLDSDEEINAADVDEIQYYGSSGEEEDPWEFDSNERSLVDSDEEREVLRRKKAKDPKINNSFTGPYPLDPTDFNHTDKGPNNQFEHLLHE